MSEPRVEFSYTPVNQHEMVYRNLVRDTLCGEPVESRSHPSIAIFGVMASFDMRLGFPIMTGRKLYPRGVLGELAAFLEGCDYAQDFRKRGCNYWDAWAMEDGYLGPIYGVQWRRNGKPANSPQKLDQLRNVIEEAKVNPASRRLVVTAWDPDPRAMAEMALPPCHYAFQLNCGSDNTLDLMFHMRSLDLMVGLPSDLILYGTLLRLIAKELKREPRFLKVTVGSCHIYDNHRANALEYLDRRQFAPPRQIFYKDMTVDNFDPDHVVWENYHFDEPLNFELNV